MKIETLHAPGALGPYSQAVVAGGFLFASGQVPIDPTSGALVAGGLREQAEQVMKNLTAVLTEAEVGWQDVVKTTIYLTDLGGFQQVNALYGEYLDEPYPARAAVQVAALPLGAQIEIDLVAALPHDPNS